MKWQGMLALIPGIVLAGGLLGAAPGNAQVAGSVESGLQALARDLIASAPEDRRPPLSVLPFPGADQSCPILSVFVVDELTTTFITSVEPRPRVVERQQLEAIISQNQLDDFLTDPEQRQRLGGLSGIGAVVLGTFAPIGDRLRINARMVAIDTGETIGAANVSVPRTREMEDLLRQGSGRGLNCLPDIRRSGGGAPRAGAASAAASAPMAAALPRPGDNTCIQDGELSACALSLSKNQNNGLLNLVIRITNRGDEPVAIALIGPPPALVGTDGESPSFDEANYAGTARCYGLQSNQVDTCLGNRANYLPPNTYTRVGPQASSNAIFRFRGDISSEASASFSAVFAVLKAGNQAAGGDRRTQGAAPATFPVGLSELRVGQQQR